MSERINWDRLDTLAFLGCLLLGILQAGLILAVFSKLPPQIPLFYSREWGLSQLTSPFFLWIVPAVAVLCVGVNFFLTRLKLESKFLVRILVAFSILVVAMSFYNTVKIISLLI